MQLSESLKEFVKKELGRYETKRSAIIPCLFKLQEENGGWISDEGIGVLAAQMDMPETWVNEVFHFYTMFNKKPVGKHHVQVCCNISCAMNGGRELTAHLEKEFGVKAGEVTADKKFSFSKVECLGSCGTAPMMQVNEDYHEGLTHEKAVEILKGLS